MGKEVPQMVSGLGMALHLVSSLYKGIEKRGGHQEILHHLTTNRGCENLEKLIDFIVSLKWQVPKSLIVEIARKQSLEAFADDHTASDMHFFWGDTLRSLKIPFTQFVREHSEDGPPEPDDRPLEELRHQLHGKTAEGGMVITWNGEPHIVTHLEMGSHEPTPGDIIDFDIVERVYLTPVFYIDLNS